MIDTTERTKFQNEMMRQSMSMSQWEREIYGWVSAYCHTYGLSLQVIYDSLGEYWDWQHKTD